MRRLRTEGLTVSAGTGAVTFGNTVGGTAALASLTVTGPTTLDGNVTTTGAQSYNSAVTLGATDTLTTTNSAGRFRQHGGRCDAESQGLTVSAGTGAVTFGSTVGASSGAGEPDGDRSDHAGRQCHDHAAHRPTTAR